MKQDTQVIDNNKFINCLTVSLSEYKRTYFDKYVTLNWMLWLVFENNLIFDLLDFNLKNYICMLPIFHVYELCMFCKKNENNNIIFCMEHDEIKTVLLFICDYCIEYGIGDSNSFTDFWCNYEYIDFEKTKDNFLIQYYFELIKTYSNK